MVRVRAAVRVGVRVRVRVRVDEPRVLADRPRTDTTARVSSEHGRNQVLSLGAHKASHLVGACEDLLVESARIRVLEGEVSASLGLGVG